MNVNIVPVNYIYELVYNYGPSLRENMSDMDSKTYEVYYKDRIPEEKVRMRLFENHFSYAVPSKKAVSRLKKYIGDDKVLELNARYGLWSYLLYNEYIDIISTTNFINVSYPLFLPVEQINYIDALQKYQDRETLLIVCNNDYFINKDIDVILNTFTGDRIVLICKEDHINQLSKKITGGDQVVISRLKSNKKDINQWIMVESFNLPQWLDNEYKIFCLEKL